MLKQIIKVPFYIALIGIISCSDDPSSSKPDTENPIISITAPANNTEFDEGSIVTISVDVTDNEEIKEVKFYIDGLEVGKDSSKPYSFAWNTSAKYGTFALHAKVFDTSDNEGITEVISIIVNEVTVTDIDGNVYKTVKIGNQRWMTENLKVTHYSNGDTIPAVSSDPSNFSEWKDRNTGAYCVYENLEGNRNIYGLLYNKYAINDNRGIAPEGWHIPTDDEWKELEIFLGMSQSQADYAMVGIYRGTDEGGKLKEIGTEHWNNPNQGATNQSGFTALPGGFRDAWFTELGESGYFWTSSWQHTNSWTWIRQLGYNQAGIVRTSALSYYGLSIRCVKD